jgi:hypothetical protein
VTDSGIVLAGPDYEISLDGTAVELGSSDALVKLEGTNISILASKDVDVHAAGHADFFGATTHLGGSGNCAQAAGKGDFVNGGSTDANGAVVAAQITTGSAHTFVC